MKPSDQEDEQDMYQEVKDMLRTRIRQVLSCLTYREREIIILRYGLQDGYSYTLEEVGRIFNLSRERIRQIEVKAVRKLQQPPRVGNEKKPQRRKRRFGGKK